MDHLCIGPTSKVKYWIICETKEGVWDIADSVML